MKPKAAPLWARSMWMKKWSLRVAIAWRLNGAEVRRSVGVVEKEDIYDLLGLPMQE